MPGRRGPSRRGTSASVSGSAPQGSLVLSGTAFSIAVTAGAAGIEFSQDAFDLSQGGPGQWLNPQVGIGLSAGSGWCTLRTQANADGSRTYYPTITATSLTAGSYTATITLTDANCSNSPQVVTIGVQAGSSQAAIGLSPTTLAFSYPTEAAGVTKTITISNTSQNGTLATPTVGTIVYGGDFTGFLDSGTAITDNGDGTFDLDITPASLGITAGDATAIVPIVSTGASNTPQSVLVNVSLTQSLSALLIINRSIDDAAGTVGGGDPGTDSQAIISGNAAPLGTTTIQSSAYSGAHTGWATSQITAGTYQVAYDISGIATPGTSYYDAVIVDTNASNSVAHRTVLVIGGGATPDQMILTPNVLTKQLPTLGGTSSDYVTVTNLSGNGVPALGTITVTENPPVSWLAVAYNSGSAQIQATYDPSGLADGVTVSTSIVVSATGATNSPLSITVQLSTTTISADGYVQPLYGLPFTDDAGGTDGIYSSVTDGITYVPFDPPALNTYA